MSEPEIYIDITVDDVRQAINDMAEGSAHWCLACGAIDAAPLCHACERDVWMLEGGKA